MLSLPSNKCGICGQELDLSRPINYSMSDHIFLCQDAFRLSSDKWLVFKPELASEFLDGWKYFVLTEDGDMEVAIFHEHPIEMLGKKYFWRANGSWVTVDWVFTVCQK